MAPSLFLFVRAGGVCAGNRPVLPGKISSRLYTARNDFTSSSMMLLLAGGAQRQSRAARREVSIACRLSSMIIL
jgi:hypothetical protein